MPGFVPTRADLVARAAFHRMLRMPPGVRRRVAGPPVVVDGEPLDTDIQAGLRVLNRLPVPPLETRSVAQARAQVEKDSWIFGGTWPAVGERRDLRIPGRGGGIPARLTRPLGTHGRRLPLVVYYHGGGWVIGSMDSHESVARGITAGAGVAVLNVDYRLAPEHPFPAGLEDAVDAFRWAHAQADDLGVDPDRIAVAGDSAGANLAAVVANLTTREGGPRPAHQYLVVPGVDFTRKRASRRLFAEGYLLTDANIDWYELNYLGVDGDRSDPRASPYLEPDLTGVPPAYIVTAGFDPLRDEGEDYAIRLREFAVPVVQQRHPRAVHPFLNVQVTAMGRRGLADLNAEIRRTLTPARG